MTTSPHTRIDILSYLEKVKRLSSGRYVACCPCHPDEHASLSVTFTPEGKTLAYCFACGARGSDVCKALELPISSLFPPEDNKLKPSAKSGRFPAFSAFQFFVAAEKDVIVLYAIAQYLMNEEKLNDADFSYLTELMIRFNQAIDVLREVHRND